MKNKFLIISVIVISVGFALWIITMQSQKTGQNSSLEEIAMQERNSNNSIQGGSEINSAMDEKSGIPADNRKMMQKESSEDSVVMNNSGKYVEYSEAIVAEEQAKGNTVVLFFYAPWCPFCRSADEAFNNRILEIPAKVTVLKTDYDSNTDLKKKYAVTYQHTFVQINADGNSVSKWNGGDIENLKSNLK